MEIEIGDVSGLPEGLKTIVAARDGKTFLDLGKVMASEDLTGLKSALQKERESTVAWAKFGRPDDVAKRIADLEASIARGSKGGEDAQAKLDAMKADYEVRIAERDGQFAHHLREQASDRMKVELAKTGFITDAIDDIAASAMARVAFGKDGAIRVTTADGKPMIGSAADHGATLNDLAKELAVTKKWALLDGGVGGGGKPAGSSGGKPGTETITRAQFDAMSTTERTRFGQGGGKIVVT